MSKTTSVNIGNHFESIISKWMQDGRYGSASEAMRAGLRLLEEQETKFELLQRSLVEGVNSGESNKSFSEIVKEAKSEIHGRKIK
ncbi:MAG: Antitoxin ParD1 [Parcubacteria bacterium OLB19]|nr:MAG: Antitoxin ParD1 [Parcubacteria bacterium OLB19]